MLLSILIVNYNVKFFVEQCLLSIYKNRGLDLDQVEVFVVDNCSTDHSVAYLKKQITAENYPHLHWIANRRNVGFGRANNQALKEAKGKYILFLNPDTLLTENTLADVLEFAQMHPDLGALGVKMLHSNGKFALESRRGIPTPWAAFCRMSGLTSLFPRSKRFGRYYMQYQPTEQPCTIDIVSGAFMLTSRQSLQQTGGFDESFFMYGEDIDLSCRLLQQGLQNYYCPTPIVHYKGESTKKNTYRYVHVFYQAMLLFFNKHYKHYGRLLSIPIQIAILLRGIFEFTLRQIRFFGSFLHPRHSQNIERMLYLGTHSEQVEQIASAYGLDIDCQYANEQSCPDGHLEQEKTPEKYVYVVYDLEDYSLHNILRLFEKQPSKKIHLGTFNPQRNIIVTGNSTYTLLNQP